MQVYTKICKCPYSVLIVFLNVFIFISITNIMKLSIWPVQKGGVIIVIICKYKYIKLKLHKNDTFVLIYLCKNVYNGFKCIFK